MTDYKKMLIDRGSTEVEINEFVKKKIADLHNLVDEETALLIMLKEKYNWIEPLEGILAEIVYVKEGSTSKGKKYWRIGLRNWDKSVDDEAVFVNDFSHEKWVKKNEWVRYTVKEKNGWTNLETLYHIIDPVLEPELSGNPNYTKVDWDNENKKSQSKKELSMDEKVSAAADMISKQWNDILKDIHIIATQFEDVIRKIERMMK